MRIIRNELKKSVFMPMLWIFLAICILLNICLIAGYRYKIVDFPFFSYVNDTASVTGTMLGDEFSEKLSSLPGSAYKKRLVSETADPDPVYADYDTAQLSEAYINAYGISGAWADFMKKKYEKLQYAVEKLDKAHAEFSLYSADTTAQMHHLLFGIVLRAVIAEACILAVLIMLHLCAYERRSQTAMMVYTTKTGREIFKYKLWAGLTASGTCFAVISAATLLIYFLVFDYSQLWDANVSSGFNCVSDLACTKPFITWIPFTVGSYLAATLGLGLSLTMVFAMMGALIGFLLRSSYLGALLFFLIALAMITIPYLFSEAGIWGGYFLTQFLPVPLWLASPLWLTDMGSISVIPLHEMAVIFANMVVWGLFVFIAYRYIKRKDVV